jgi:tetratricopeptide (TPR) repeat protein
MVSFLGDAQFDNGVFGMTKARELLLGAVGLALVAAAVAAAYLYEDRKQRLAAETTALVEDGIAQFRQEQYEAALEILRGIPEKSVEDWRIPYYTGSALIKLNDYESAAVSLEEALILNSKEENIPFALGVVYYKLGNLGLSKSYFHSVLEINPDNEEAKGLMDIMAKLERAQPGEATPEPELKNTELPENGSQPTDLTSTSEDEEDTGNQ